MKGYTQPVELGKQLQARRNEKEDSQPGEAIAALPCMAAAVLPHAVAVEVHMLVVVRLGMAGIPRCTAVVGAASDLPSMAVVPQRVVVGPPYTAVGLACMVVVQGIVVVVVLRGRVAKPVLVVAATGPPDTAAE